MNTRTRIVAATVTGFLITHLPTSGADTVAVPAPTKQVTYAADMKTIFDTSCAKCHNAGKPKAGLSLDSLEGVLQAGKKRKLVNPGNSADSRLVKLVESISAASNDPKGKTKSMHKKGPKPFTPEQIALLKSWIDQGAK